MKDKKITFKYFSIAEYEKEEAYLRKMHQQGWKLVKISLRYLCVRAYIFEKCQPEDVIYRIDYDQTGGDAYIQMFADCGWEYLFDFDESSYFRKKKEDVAEDEDIFCDDASRLAMVRRVFKARYIPYLTLCVSDIIFWIGLDSLIYMGSGKSGLIITMILWITILLALLYLGVLTMQFYKCEKKLAEETEAAEGVKYKYIGLAVLWVALALVTGILILYANRSDYSVTDRDNGFSIESKRMNTELEREYEAQKGEQIAIGHDIDDGYIEITIEDSEGQVLASQSYEDWSEDIQTIVVPKDVRYRIICKGRHARGSIQVNLE